MVDEKRVSISELGRDLTQLPSSELGGSSPIATQAELVKSQSVLNRALDQVFPEGTSNSPQGKLTSKKLSQRLKVKTIPATNIFELSYQDENPTLATKLLNAVSEAVVQESAEAIRSQARSVRTFLQAEIPNRRAELDQAEAAENKYRQTNGVISLADQTKSLVESLATLENQERAVSAQLQEVRTRDSSLQKITGVGTLKNAYTAVRIGEDEQLKNLRAKLADLEAKVIDSRSRLKENNPVLLKLLEQRDATRALYTQQLSRMLSRRAIAPANVASDQLSQNLISKLVVGETERLTLEKQLSVVQAQRANLQARLAQLPIKQQPLAALIRRREEAEVSLKLLQGKLEEARIAEAQLVSNNRVIDWAHLPSSPTWPKLSVVLVLANLAGLMLAVGVVLLLEVMDNTLRDASEAEELLKLPLVGVLPELPANALNLESPERFLDDVGLVEPYRMLLKTLEFRGSEKLRLMVVSSTISGEGKSIVVSHLAAVSAMLSRRTLIIDADLHQPVQHNLFNLPPGPGITDVIDGDKTFLSAVQPTSIENLAMLTYGTRHTRPSQLLESASMKTLLAEAAARYDLVIVDTPPAISCADALTLSRYSDALVLIARPSFTPKEIMLRTVSELTRNGVPILGFIVNGITTQTEKYYRYPVKEYKPPSKPLKRLTEESWGSWGSWRSWGRKS
jgi:capsular exopolysaccharide synthesis family protein